MNLYLITIGDEHSEGTVICPMLCPAESLDQAEAIAQTVAEEFGVEVMETPKLLREFGDSGLQPSAVGG